MCSIFESNILLMFPSCRPELPMPQFVPKESVSLPALKQTLGTKAAERRRRTQVLQKTRSAAPSSQPQQSGSDKPWCTFLETICHESHSFALRCQVPVISFPTVQPRDHLCYWVSVWMCIECNQSSLRPRIYRYVCCNDSNTGSEVNMTLKLLVVSERAFFHDVFVLKPSF